jgi:hypothetical protein
MKNNPKLNNPKTEAFESLEAEALYSELKSEGYPLLISKKQYASIIGTTVSTIDNYIKRGYGCPNYKKMGKAKNAKVLFSLIDTANYLAHTIKVA